MKQLVSISWMLFFTLTSGLQAATLYEDMVSGDINRVKAALKQGVDVDVRGEGGFTPLHIASNYGDFAIAKLLVAKGADVNAIAQNSNTPLHTINTTKYLEQIASMGSMFHQDIVAVEAQPGHIAIVKLLLSKGAKINQQDSEGATPLYYMI